MRTLTQIVVRPLRVESNLNSVPDCCDIHNPSMFTGSHYSTLKEDLEVIPILKISPYTHSKQAVLHIHALFKGSRYTTLKEDLEVIPILKISP